MTFAAHSPVINYIIQWISAFSYITVKQEKVEQLLGLGLIIAVKIHRLWWWFWGTGQVIIVDRGRKTCELKFKKGRLDPH